MSGVVLLVIDDGRGTLDACRESIAENLPPFEHEVLVDDSAHGLGFDGAVREGWYRVLEMEAEYVFHLESDFLLNERVPLGRMIGVLRRQPQLTQMSLLRQAVNHEERAAGGIVHAHPDQYHEVTESGDTWTQTERFIFTTNPSVYSTEMCKRLWPNAPESEGRFGAMLRRENPSLRCGIWGGKWDEPRVEHIGHRRAGCRY